MPNQWDLTNENIENTYQRVLQTPDGVNIYDGTGSLFTVTASPAGPDQSVQFRDGSATSGSSNFTFNKNNDTVTLTGSLNITGSTLQTGNNTLAGNTILSGSIIISGAFSTNNPTVRIYGDTTHDGYIRFDPVSTNIDTSISASYIYVSGSTNDLYFSQNGNGYTNTTRLRWLEGNLYTGLLNGGVISATNGGTTFNISSGSGIIVNLNASLNDNPYPTVTYVNWGNFTNQTITYRTSSIQTFLGIDSNGQIIQQVNPWFDGQYNTSISLGTVIHQNQSTVNATITYPNVAYGYKQRTYDFIKAFGPLKLSGFKLNTSSSLGLTVEGGTAFADGRNYQVDPNNPSYITDPGTTVSKIFRYYQSGSSFVQDTNNALGYTGIDTTQFNLNGSGSLTSVSPSKFYVHRIFWYPNSATKGIVDYYGLSPYDTLDEAQTKYVNEPFLETPNTQQNAIFLGIVIVKGNSDFTSANDYRVVQSGLFRATGVGGGGGGGATTPGGLDHQIQYNDGGLFNGVPVLTYDGTTLRATGSFIGPLIGTASWADSASQALTASFYQETDPIFVAKSASLATTGSNTFIGDQIVSGSIITTGSIGIGISTPITKLHVTSGSSGASIQSSDTAVFESNNHTNISILSPTSQNSSLQFGSAGDILGAYVKWNQANNLMTLGTANDGDNINFVTGNETSSMYLRNNIGLGIGTTTPLYRLHVRNGEVTPSATFGGSVGVFENSGSNTYVSILSHNNYSSAVGFGSNISRSAARLLWNHDSQNFNLATNIPSAFLTFGTGNETERMRITSGGLVGIGITTPQYMLDVSGSARVTSSLYLPGLTSSPEVNVILINTSSGQLYYTSSTAFGGGSSTPTFPYTGSAIISGSLTVTGSVRVTDGITGSLNGVATQAIASNQIYIAENTSPGTYSIPVYPDGGFDGNNTLSTANLTYDYNTQALTVNAITASNGIYTSNVIATASVSSNTITFTKGDGSTFPITVDTGSGGGGGGTNLGLVYAVSLGYLMP